MKGIVLLCVVLFLAGECMAQMDANDPEKNTGVFDGKYLYELGTKYNKPLLRLIGKAFLDSDKNNRNGSDSQLRDLQQNFSDFQHNMSVRLCELHPCTEWGSWSVCSATKGQFAMVTRSRNCNKTDLCQQTRPTNLITTESKVCEGRSNCPTSYEAIDGLFCLKFYSIRSNQPDAKKVCHTDGGYLVHIDTKMKSDTVHALLSRHGHTKEIWISGERTKAGGLWTFEYGSDPAFSNWKLREPSGGLNELCKVDQDNSGQRMWYDRECTSSYAFVCEIV